MTPILPPRKRCSVPKLYLSDKQLPQIPSDSLLGELLEMTKKSTPGERHIKQREGEAQFQLVTAQGGFPLGRADAELAATLTPELVRGLLYKIHLLTEARDEACRLAQDALGSKISPALAVKLSKLLEKGTQTS